MLPASQRQAVVNQIPKKDRDRLYLKNWRPISLLNQDYKIASKVIARRTQRVLPSVIHPDQCACIRDRYIGKAVHILADVMHHTKETNSPGILLFCDFEKAFDSVDWSCLFKTFETFNFGPSLSRWVKTFCNKITICVMNGDTSSRYFYLGRGVRQGDPLSAYLFILVIELLVNAIRSDDNMKGISVGNRIIKSVIYADDLSATVSDIHSAKTLLKLIECLDAFQG